MINVENDDALRQAVEVLQAVRADMAGNDDLLAEVLERYRHADTFELRDFVSTSLAMVSLLIRHLATLQRSSEEEIIDSLLLDFT